MGDLLYFAAMLLLHIYFTWRVIQPERMDESGLHWSLWRCLLMYILASTLLAISIPNASGYQPGVLDILTTLYPGLICSMFVAWLAIIICSRKTELIRELKLLAANIIWATIVFLPYIWLLLFNGGRYR